MLGSWFICRIIIRQKFVCTVCDVRKKTAGTGKYSEYNVTVLKLIIFLKLHSGSILFL